MASEERLRELEEKYEGFTVYDNQGSKIGKVDDLFVDEKDSEEYIGVKMGFLGMKSTLIPTEVVRVNENDRTIEVAESKDHVKDAPSFDDDEDVTAEYEERIRRHFGLESLQSGSGRGSYGGSSGSSSDTAGAAAGPAAGTGTSDSEEGRESSRSSDYAPEGGDRETSTGETREDTYSGDRGSTSETYGDRGSSGGSSENDRETSSGVDTEYGERHEDSGSAAVAGQTGGSSDYTGDQEGYQGSGSSGATEASQQGASSPQPATSKQTEETETFQEGGRTKIRRRIVREEIVDADDQGSHS